MLNKPFSTRTPGIHADSDSDSGKPSPEIRASIDMLRQQWGGGATWNQAEVLTLPGAAPHWRDRWQVVWEKIRSAKLDDTNQEWRLRKAAELAADMIGSPSPEKAEQFESLRLDCMPPPAFAKIRQDLWAACSNVGLIFLLAEADDIFRLLEDGAPYALPQIPTGRFAVVRLEAAVEFASDQKGLWAAGAADAGVLYGVEPIPPKPV